jgi:hypothetical protein
MDIEDPHITAIHRALVRLADAVTLDPALARLHDGLRVRDLKAARSTLNRCSTALVGELNEMLQESLRPGQQVAWERAWCLSRAVGELRAALFGLRGRHDNYHDKTWIDARLAEANAALTRHEALSIRPRRGDES